jgi:hemoglobin/transferrin/lactoferrin receptor protein
MKRILGCFTACVFLSNLLFAQVFNNSDSIKSAPPLREVTISSQRYEKKLDEISLPVELISSDFIKSVPAATASDLMKYQGGVSLTRDGIWATGITIRGLGKNSIVTLVDGNRIETATDLAAGLSLFNNYDIERIEIVKGSSSVLYGTGAVGGVVNIFTKQARYNETFYINGSLLGGYNSVNKMGDGGLLLFAGNSNWNGKIFTDIRSSKNTQTGSGELLNSQFRDRAFSAALAFRPQSSHEIKFNYQNFTASDVGIPGGSSLFPLNALVKYSDINREMFSAEYKISNFYKSLSLLSVKYYFQNIFRYVENIPYQVQTVPAQNGNPAKRVNVLKITPNARHYTEGLQMQTDWILSGNNYLIAGADIWKRTLDSKREKFQKIEILNSSNAVVNVMNKVIGERPVPESDFRNIGFYANDEMKFLDNRLTINAGARFDGIKVTNKKTYNPVYEITNGVVNNTPANQSLYWDEREVNDYSWSGSLGLLYMVTPKLDFTINISRSFRSPSLEERYQYIDLGNYLRIGTPDLKPEDGYFFDLGTRYWGEDLNFRVNVFANFIKDMIVELPGTYQGKQAYIKSNAGKARLLGFDFTAEAKIFSALSAYFTGGYVRGRDTEDDSDLPQVPPLNGIIGIKAQLEEIVRLDLNATLFSKQDKTASGEIQTPGYVYYNLYASSNSFDFNLVKFSISAGVENIFNKAYRNHLASNRGLITDEPGRNFFVKLQIDW